METEYEVLALSENSFARTGTDNGRAHEEFPRSSAVQARTTSTQDFDELEFDRYTEFHLSTRELTETTNDIGALGGQLKYIISDFNSYLDLQGRLSGEIQDRLLRLRMLPFASIATRLHRTVRVTAKKLGKKVNLVIEGEQVELDKTVMEEISDPLLHILRNSVDHGIENIEKRKSLDKTEVGEIKLKAYNEGTQVFIEISDDGAGVNTELVRSLAVERGYVSESDATNLSESGIYSLIFEPGFSTSDSIHEISGRGVGMDVVKSTISKMKGTVNITSEQNKGMTTIIRLPMSLAITRVLMLKSNDETFAIPSADVIQIVRMTKTEIDNLGEGKMIHFRDNFYPLINLGEMLNLKNPQDPTIEVFPILIINVGANQFALQVDRILEAREIVIKNLGTEIGNVHGIAGATLTGDGSVVLIINPIDFINEKVDVNEFSSASSFETDIQSGILDVLIVDDSLSVRRVLSNTVRNNGWNPNTAKDGLEALEMIQRVEKNPDVILLDIEMPRMDGYELASSLKSNKLYKDIPIIIITSRAGEKHKQKAFEIGVDDYLTKPYQ